MNVRVGQAVKLLALMCGSYAVAQEGAQARHWINEVTRRGSLVVLEDGSIWKVDAVDRVTTMLWLPVDNIAIVQSEVAGKYIMVNTTQNQQATVEYLGQE
jgi:hypothetical protein